MPDFASPILRKVGSIVAGLALFIVFATVKGWFSRGPSHPDPDGPPAPAGRLALTLDGASVELKNVQAFLEHGDDDRVQLVFDSTEVNVFGLLDINGDGRLTKKDEFPGDVDDVRSCDVLKGRAFALKCGDEAFVTLPGKGKCVVESATVTPREYWRPKGYSGTDGWRGEIEIRLKAGGTLKGTFEGPVTHAW